jgi:hypothetical protein
LLLDVWPVELAENLPTIDGSPLLVHKGLNRLSPGQPESQVGETGGRQQFFAELEHFGTIPLFAGLLKMVGAIFWVLSRIWGTHVAVCTVRKDFVAFRQQFSSKNLRRSGNILGCSAPESF